MTLYLGNDEVSQKVFLNGNVGVQLPEMSSDTNGQVLSNDGTNPVWVDEQVGYKQITNCITKIPQDIKLELNEGILTLKAGSKVYVPDGKNEDGTNKFIEIVVDTDLSRNTFGSSSYKALIIPRYNNGKIDLISSSSLSSALSGTTLPELYTGNFYNTTTNYMNAYEAGNLIDTRAFPIGIMTLTNGVCTSIDQVFNGFGFMGSIPFILPGVECLCPNGLNEDGTLNNIKWISNSVIIRTDSSNQILTINPSLSTIGSGVDFTIDDNYDSNNFNGYLYDKSKNLMYVSGSGNIPSSRCIYAEATFNGNNFTSLKPRIITNIPTFNDVVTKDEYLTENEIQRQIFNRIYDGRDLTQVFANEISNYSDEWAWIKARITAGDYSGLYVGDYIPVTMNAGTVGESSIAQQTFKCQIAGIDTYTGCCDTEQGHHIDFISKEVIDTTITWNPANNNNGTSVQSNPWLASQAYAWLNGVNNYTTSAYNNVAHGGDYSTGGILQLLPTKLFNLIVTKRMLLEQRYSSTALLTYSLNWSWQDMGKLWLPNEIEVYGTQIRSNLGYAQGYWNSEANMAIAYPIYLASGRNRIKRTSTGGRSGWWLSSAPASDSTGVCHVGSLGDATGYAATNTSFHCPLCFRIA